MITMGSEHSRKSGDKEEHFDSAGFKIGETRFSTDISGDHFEEHFDKQGFKIGESRRGGHYDNGGFRIGYDMDGAFGEKHHYDSSGKRVGTTRKSYFLWGSEHEGEYFKTRTREDSSQDLERREEPVEPDPYENYYEDEYDDEEYEENFYIAWHDDSSDVRTAAISRMTDRTEQKPHGVLKFMAGALTLGIVGFGSIVLAREYDNVQDYLSKLEPQKIERYEPVQRGRILGGRLILEEGRITRLFPYIARESESLNKIGNEMFCVPEGRMDWWLNHVTDKNGIYLSSTDSIYAGQLIMVPLISSCV